MALLARTPNPSAKEVLQAGISDQPSELAEQALRAFFKRHGADNAEAIVDLLPTLPPKLRKVAAEPRLLKKLEPVLALRLADPNIESAKRACKFAAEAEACSLIAPAVKACCDGTHPYLVGLATTILRLSALLAERIDDTDPEHQHALFDRRSALNALTEAVESYARHDRLELVEAFLMLTTADNTELIKVLESPTHFAHRAMAESLQTSRSTAVMNLLVRSLRNPLTPVTLLKALARRDDLPFVKRLTAPEAESLSLRSQANLERMGPPAWASIEHRKLWLALPGPSQAIALKLVATAGVEPAEWVPLIKAVYEAGEPEGRCTAVTLLHNVERAVAIPILQAAIKDPAPSVVAAAARLLRHHDFDEAILQLVDLLEHPAKEVQQAAREHLSELNYVAYRDLYPKMSEASRANAGALVARIDTETPSHLAKDLKTPTARKKLFTLELIESMGLSGQLLEPLSNLLSDGDAGVRSEAVRLLGSTDSPASAAYLTDALKDDHASVRQAAELAIKALPPLEAAEGLLDVLQAEEHQR